MKQFLSGFSPLVIFSSTLLVIRGELVYGNVLQSYIQMISSKEDDTSHEFLWNLSPSLNQSSPEK